jgi:pyruvate,water dikinase
MTGVEVGLGHRFIVAAEDCRPDDVAEVGGKAVGLGSLLRTGQRVPRCFVITASAHAMASTSRASIRRAVEESYERLGDGRVDPAVVAVRSSATVEDSSESSCAGQFLTFLGARGAQEVLEQVERCWQSALDPRVESYRSNRQMDGGDRGLAVIVQELVDARAAGVMFTRHPHNGDRSLVVIESSYGLGESVVGGEVTPDLFEVNKITRDITRRHLGVKPRELRLSADRRTVETLAVEADRQAEWSINDDEVQELVSLALDLEAKLGRGLDIEWAIGSTNATTADQLFALQVRPITVTAPTGSVSAGKSPIDFVLGRLSGRSDSTRGGSA